MNIPQITDYSLWDLRDRFSDYEAAYLWLGLEPSYGNDHPDKVISLRLTLSEAQQRGELMDVTPYRRHSSGIICIPVTRYSRQNLREWATSKGQRPLFLFPEDRPADYHAILSVDQQRLPMVVAAATELGFNLLAMPRGGKERIKEKLMNYPAKMTEDQFESTWAFGKKKELLKN